MRIKLTKINITAILVLLAALLSLCLLFGADWSKPPPQNRAEIVVSDTAAATPGDQYFPGILADEVLQIDFALAQSMSRLHWSAARMQTTHDELQEQHGIAYHYKTLNIYAGNQESLFIQTLRDALLAWAEKARLEQGAEAGVWNILLDGLLTHRLYIFNAVPPNPWNNFGRLPGSSMQPDQQDKPAPQDHPDKPKQPHQTDVQTQTPQDILPAGQLKLVIVLDDLGESIQQANFLLQLDYPVTFAVWPRSTHATEVAELAADHGLELIIHQPMEPMGYPKINPGAGVLLSRMSDNEFMAVLRENLKLMPKAIGLNNHMGSWLTQNATLMSMVARELKERNLFVLDSLTHQRSRFADAARQESITAYRRDIFLDVQPEMEQVLAQLRKAENVARLKGQAIAIGHPLPETLEALAEWQLLRDRRIDIVHLRDLKPLE
ncbi:MAG: divergent polysaccharide deacetylase family protein [Deltaproteobacteria bacterium]|jgi:polysaccharide deacetylase 2 family uncharacterized protein YibQ|nr:divergent polysaccharide deacetylase family protein [Deltaproteobacteria bacterium]